MDPVLAVILSCVLLVLPGWAIWRWIADGEDPVRAAALAIALSIGFWIGFGMVFGVLGLPVRAWIVWPVAAGFVWLGLRAAKPEAPADPLVSEHVERPRPQLPPILIAGFALWLIAIAAAVAGTGPMPWWSQAAWIIGALLIALGMRSNTDTAAFTVRHPSWWVAGAVVVAWVMRLLPQRHTDVPLGYDRGFYHDTFVHYEAAGWGARGQPAWMEIQFPPGLPGLHEVLHAATGLDAASHLAVLWPLLAAVGALAVAASLDKPHHQVAAAWLFVASMAQFRSFQLLYEKNAVALLLATAVLILIQSRRSWTAGLLAVIVLVVHRPTALWLALAAFPVAAYAIARRRDVGLWLRVGAPATLGAAAAAMAFPEVFAGLAKGVASGIGSALIGGEVGKGSFDDLATLQRWHIIAWPLALVGLVGAARTRPLWASAAATGALYVLLGLPFHKRMAIMLDWALIGWGAIGLCVLVAWLPTGRPQIRPAAAATAIVLAALVTVPVAYAPPDWPFEIVDDEELDLLRWAGENVPGNYTMLAASTAAPSLAAEVDHAVIGPGLFDDPTPPFAWEQLRDDRDAIGGALIGYRLAPALAIVLLPAHPGLATDSFHPDFTEIVHASPAGAVLVFDREAAREALLEAGFSEDELDQW